MICHTVICKCSLKLANLVLSGPPTVLTVAMLSFTMQFIILMDILDSLELHFCFHLQISGLCNCIKRGIFLCLVTCSLVFLLK